MYCSDIGQWAERSNEVCRSSINWWLDDLQCEEDTNELELGGEAHAHSKEQGVDGDSNELLYQ